MTTKSYGETSKLKKTTPKLRMAQVLPWSKHTVQDITEKLTIAHLVKQFTVCNILKVITVLTKSFSWILS
jgi:hypothetical protein